MRGRFLLDAQALSRRAHTLRRSASRKGFTLIELVIVIAIIGIAFAVLAIQTGTVSYWREEGFLRQMTETINFLHYQAVTDQAFYRMEISYKDNNYRVGVFRAEEDVDPNLQAIAATAGNLSLELAGFLSPSIGQSQTMIPPPNYPSLFEYVPLPQGARVESVRTQYGLTTRDTTDSTAIMFSPRGFSEFAVLHITLASGAPITILVNPFTGVTEIYHEDRDFQWTWSKKSDS